MTRKVSITLSLDPDVKDELINQAISRGFFYGDKVNASAYITAFVKGRIKPNQDAIALIQEGLEKLME